MQNNENNLLQYVEFAKNIRKGDWNAAKDFLRLHPEAVSKQISYSGNTALHIAILGGHTNIVEELVKQMSEENLEIKDNDGLTVLGCSAIVGNIQITKCITQKNRRLLSIGNSTNQLIPVVLAAVYNAIDLVRYLYFETPLEDLKPENGINGATFITRCIYAKAFDMDLKLLEHYPSLATALEMRGESPVLALACMSFAYPSGNQLIF